MFAASAPLLRPHRTHPPQAVGPVAVSSMLLGAGLADIFDGRVNENPNAPADPILQQEYNQAAVQVCSGG